MYIVSATIRIVLSLDPPIQFGSITRTNKHFANRDITRFSTAFGQKSFHYKGTTWWNALPSDFYQIPAHSYYICARFPGLFVIDLSSVIYCMYIAIICMFVVVS